MTAQLVTGERFNLTQAAPQLQQIALGLGWQVTQATGQTYDIDASVFMVGEDEKIPEEEYFVFYNNLVSPDQSVRHFSNNKSGYRSQDEQTIAVELNQVNPTIQEIIIVVTIHEAKEKRQDFSQVRNAYIRLYDPANGNEIARYNLTDEFTRERALEFGKLYKRNNEWRFHAVGQGYNMGLQSFVDKYYVETKQKAGVGIRQPEDFNITQIDVLKNQVDKVLEAKKLVNFKVRIGLALEVSDSMPNWMNPKNLQKIIESVLALSSRLDTYPEVDLWIFNDTQRRLPSVTEANFENYVNREISSIASTRRTGGEINYAPVMVDILQKYLQESKRKYPSLMAVVGSGKCSDAQKAELVLKTASKYSIFWQFIGVPVDAATASFSNNFEFLKSLDVLAGRKVDNASFSELNPLSLEYEDEFYQKLLNEFPYWLIEAQSQNIVE